MRGNYNLLFYLRKQKSTKAAPSPSTCVLPYVDGKRAETSTGRTVEPERWNGRDGRAIGSKEDARTLNAYLDSLRNKVATVH